MYNEEELLKREENLKKELEKIKLQKEELRQNKMEMFTDFNPVLKKLNELCKKYNVELVKKNDLYMKKGQELKMKFNKQQQKDCCKQDKNEFDFNSKDKQKTDNKDTSSGTYHMNMTDKPYAKDIVRNEKQKVHNENNGYKYKDSFERTTKELSDLLRSIIY